MPQIKVLPIELRNKIAAGEVIERPASVVKELIENSIDAGSLDIRVDILKGGKGLIKVTDNGAGMDREDAMLCFQPHATSKLKNEDDLFNIRTMGFRGEALPSIASVSRMRLTTGVKDSTSGISIEIAAGEVRESRDCPAIGTSIEIRDLFFNTPARKKFLKADSTEVFHIVDTVTRLALPNYEIGFRLFTEKQETINLPRASGLRERLMQIYGAEFLEELLEVKAVDYGINMTAFITRETGFRNNKTHQFIFINRRPIRDTSLSHAVYRTYEDLLPQNRHPVFFLHLTMDPKQIDFNVHPTKREVRFEDKETIYQFIVHALRNTFRSQATYQPRPVTVSENNLMSEPGAAPEYGIKPALQTFVAENLELGYTTNLPFIYLGDTFVAFSDKGGLTLMDYHAAHERVLYEKLLKGINLQANQLLFPSQIRLSPKEYMVLFENRAMLFEMGIELDAFGHDTLIVRAIPDALKGGDLQAILRDTAAAITDKTLPHKSVKEPVAARIACHSSVRGREILSQDDLRALVSDIEKADHPDQCPHGRPTMLYMSSDDLKRMFKRK